jgi:hypothetical protein
MASNPYDDVMKRSAIIGELGKKTGPAEPAIPGQPVSTKMPVPDPATSTNPNLGAPPDLGMPKLPASPAAPIGDRRRDAWSIGRDVNDRGDFGRLTGFNANSFDPGSGEESFKNQMGRIMSRYDPRASNAIQQLAADPDFQASGYSIVGNDKIVGPDGFPVDILRNANEGGAGDAWAWQTSNPADQAGGAPAAAAAPMVGGGQSNLAAIMAEINALSQGTESPSKRKAVLDLLMPPDAPQAI